MRLITRCPACETMFKVVPDQLRISDGWVRCGQCAEIFNASQQLVDPDSLTARSTPPAGSGHAAPAQHAAPHSAQAHPSASASGPAPLAPHAPPPPAATFFATPATPTRASPDNAAIHNAPDDGAMEAAPAAVAFMPHGAGAGAGLDASHDGGAAAPFSADFPQAADPTDAPPPAPATGFAAESPESAPAHDGAPGRNAFRILPFSAPEPARNSDALTDADAADVPEPSFVRSARAAAAWRRPGVRLALLLLALVLILVLAAQVLLHERDRIVQMEPATRPALLALCALRGCTLSPPRQIESIVIDSSSFNRLRGDSYRLGLSLKNNATIDVAMPAIELALTDTQDQPLIRRVILPAELGARSGLLPAGADWNGSVSLSVSAATGSERIAGYRVLAFYP